MIVIFSRFTVDPSQRDSLDAEMAAFLDATADQRRGASTYEYLADPADPAKVFVFQTWPDERDFASWSQQPAFQEILERARVNGAITAASAIRFEGCTTARDCPSSSPPGRNMI